MRRYDGGMTTQSDAQPERRATNIRLTVPQLLWCKEQATIQRSSMSAVIEAAIVAAGAPASETDAPAGVADAAGA